jgi:restriction system protein
MKRKLLLNLSDWATCPNAWVDLILDKYHALSINIEVPLLDGEVNAFAFVALILIAILFKRRFFGGRHASYIRKSKRLVNKIAKLDADKAFIYIRKKVNPYVFEEAVLTGLSRSGYKIKRNKRYSNDGGIDGVCFIGRQKFLIQSKRYKGYISAVHVMDFHSTCEKQKAKGLFVHTGLTGKKSRIAEGKSPLIHIVSGDDLLSLLTGKFSARNLR